MDRLGYLREEYESVDRTLRETLRHDYGPERSRAFYDECRIRLAAIHDAMDTERELSPVEVADRLKALGGIASRVALLERSHLGEFSWPFAEEIRRIAELLFPSEQADGTHPPIVHVIAEGIGYQIKDDDVDQMGNRRILVVMFPRQLRHHVLLHTIFGHELGHPALRGDTSVQIFTDVVPHLSRGPLQDPTQLIAWARLEEAPESVKRLGREKIVSAVSDRTVENWRVEMFCDLFGLLLFGPSFAAAHRTILEPLSAGADDYDLEGATHPPYPLRQRLIGDAMRLLGWSDSLTTADDGALHEAEAAFLAYAAPPVGSDWEMLVEQADLQAALDGLKALLQPYSNTLFSPPTREHVVRMMDRLALCRPPVVDGIDAEGLPINERVTVQQCLHAGWAFWFGRKRLQDDARDRAVRQDLPDLQFLDVNRLCEQAILQQRAIDAVLNQPKVTETPRQ